MESRIRILSVALILMFSIAFASAVVAGEELVEAQASTAGAADPDDCDIESGDCDDTDERIEPSDALDDDSDGDGIADSDEAELGDAVDEDSDDDGLADADEAEEELETGDLDTIDNAPEEKERGIGDLDGDGYGDVLASVGDLIEEVKAALERCDDDVCSQVRANADKRYDYATTALRSDDPAVHERSLNAIKGIVEDDIATLTRVVENGEGTDVHRDVLGIERDILAMIARSDYRDEDSDGDGLADAVDEDSDDDGLADALDTDDDADGVPTGEQRRRPDMLVSEWDTLSGIEKSDIKRGMLARANEWSEEERESVSEYVRSLSELNGSDRGLAIAAFASGNERVRELRYDEETSTLEVEHEEEVRVLGLIKTKVNAQSTVDAQGRVKTRFPWWAIGPKTNLVENPLYESETASATNPLYEG